MFTAVVAALALGACSGSADEAALPAVTGTVVAPPETPPVDQLPAGAVLTVALEDISRADAPSVVLATQQIQMQGQRFPVPFELGYDLGSIQESNTYRVAARVTSGGDLLMISDTIIPVITQGAPTSGVAVALIYIADN